MQWFRALLAFPLRETTNCNDTDAICTDDSRKLLHSTSDSVQSPIGISMADAAVEEAAGATVVFTVSLSQAASTRITVDYATSDGTAQAGSDYQTTTGRLTFLSPHCQTSLRAAIFDPRPDGLLRQVLRTAPSDSHRRGVELLSGGQSLSFFAAAQQFMKGPIEDTSRQLDAPIVWINRRPPLPAPTQPMDFATTPPRRRTSRNVPHH